MIVNNMIFDDFYVELFLQRLINDGDGYVSAQETLKNLAYGEMDNKEKDEELEICKKYVEKSIKKIKNMKIDIEGKNSTIRDLKMKIENNRRTLKNIDKLEKEIGILEHENDSYTNQIIKYERMLEKIGNKDFIAQRDEYDEEEDEFEDDRDDGWDGDER